MSASHIPNLLSLRGGPRSRGSRGRGRGNALAGADSPSAVQQRKDRDIQTTDTDAAVSRLSAVSLGYLDDPFASYFVNGPATRRLPIINRGTYTRTTALDILIDSFLSATNSQSSEEPQKKQIISLGAGTDTRYFRLRDQNKHHDIIYHEFDFPSICATKRRTVWSQQRLAKCHENEELFPDVSETPFIEHNIDWGFNRVGDDAKSRTIYCCHPLDLRELPSSNIERFHGLRTDIPTLIISECCLCYMDVDISREVVKWFVDKISSLGIILYEPIGVDDSFGQMMVSNLAARNITMPSLNMYKTLSDQKERLASLGLKSEGASGGCEAETVEKIWDRWIPATEKERVDSLEGLDEVEEWQMLARHYAVAWGWRGSAGWEGWVGFKK